MLSAKADFATGCTRVSTLFGVDGHLALSVASDYSNRVRAIVNLIEIV